MVPLTGRSGLLVLLLGGTTVGRAQDSCISGDSDAQGFEVCRPATVPTATGFDSPIIPEPQKAPTIVSLAPDDALASPLIPAPDNPSPSPAPRNVSFVARCKDKKFYTSQDVYGPRNDVPQS